MEVDGEDMEIGRKFYGFWVACEREERMRL